MKPLHFVGSSREDLRDLPEDAKETTGHQLFKVQQGKEPGRLEADAHGRGRCPGNPDLGGKWELSSSLCGEV